MNNLNLDQVEKSFFLAFLQFGEIPMAMTSRGRAQIAKGIRQMKNCFLAYLKSKYSFEHWRQRQAIFYHLIDQIGEESLWRTQIIKVLVIPSLHQSGPTLFTSITNDDPEHYLTALKQQRNKHQVVITN